MALKLLICLAALASAAIASPAAAQRRANEARETMQAMGLESLSPEALAKAIAQAEQSPLGSKANPVRENMPQGQRAYLARLRCAGGTAPAAERKGNVGVGVYGYIIDHFVVACPGAAAVDVYMDMYHDGPENRPVPGFTIAAEAAPSA
jgi:hypothetical protein